MADLTVQGDPVPAVKARIGDHFGAAATIADEVPDGWNVYTSPPAIVVDDDGGPVTWPVFSEPTIRVSVFANGKQTARLLRRIALGALMKTPVPGMALLSQHIGYTEARDPDTGADVASFTVAATIHTEVITV